MRTVLHPLRFLLGAALPVLLLYSSVFAQVPMQPGALADVNWDVTQYNDGQGVLVSVLPDTQVTASFADDGTVSGNTGCNLYRGTYAIDGSSIAFGPMLTTRRACLSDAANSQEHTFLAALGASSTYELAGDTLMLHSDDGVAQIVLVHQTG